MSGEVYVTGMVSDHHLIEDIGVRVPKGTTLQLSASLVLQSKDFYQALAKGQIVAMFQPAPPAPASPPSEIDRLTKELATSRAQVEAHAARIDRLEADLEALRKVNEQLRGDLVKAQEAPAHAGVVTAKNALKKLRQGGQ